MGRRTLPLLATATATALVVTVLGAAPSAALRAPDDLPARGLSGTTKVTVEPGGLGVATADLPEGVNRAEVVVSASRDDGEAFKNLVFTLAKAPTPGQRLLTCLVMSQFDKRTFVGSSEEFDISDERTTKALVSLVSCLRVAQLVAELQAEGRPQSPSIAWRAGRGCTSEPVGLPATVRKVRNGYRMNVDGQTSRVRRPPLQVTCKRKGTKMVFGMRATARGKSLRSVLGKNLSLGVGSPATTEGSATVKVTFRKG
jgi:hypothetical protein